MPEGFARAQERYESRGRKIIAALVALGALMLVVTLIAAVQTMTSAREDNELVDHTLEVQNDLGTLNGYAERIETARRGFIIQPDPVFRSNLGTTQENFDRTLAVIERMVSDNPEQLENVGVLKELSAERRAMLAAMFASPAAARAELQAADLDSEPGTLITRRIRQVIAGMNDIEASLLIQRSRNQFNSLQSFYITAGGSLALLVLVMIAVIVLVTRYNRDLTAAQARLQRANEGLEDAVEARTAELTRANAEIQRFAYIVSHDLRSPLVNVLGFTAEMDAARKTLHGYLTKLYDDHPELKNQDAWLAVEEDLPEALEFIRTSTEKMDRLINSILELSRQGRRTLNPEQLDMTALTKAVASTMKQRADDAGATVSVDAIPPLESDRIAVEQILSNLIENALKYLSPARAGEVRVEGRRSMGRVEIAVIDNGRGIAPEDHDRIFDLFRRAGTQDQPGEGLGLANVRALAYRLGGTVNVESQLGEGARFTLILPERFVAAEPA
ncbi:ATP-binding protein [Qipengyuania sp.]|uniref:sensor histidine kinase n=1 Tax=Qipengyuania sp. TaxID=2004515 RepID=UPI0035C7CFBC